MKGVSNRSVGWIITLGFLLLYVAAFFISRLDSVPNQFWLLFFYVSCIHFATISAVIFWREVRIKNIYLSVCLGVSTVALALLGWQGLLGFI